MWAAVGKEEVLEDGKVGHGRVDHGRKRVVAILGDHDIASPCVGFLERLALYVLDALVDGKRHPISGHRRVKDDVGIGELLVHPVESLDKLLGAGMLIRRDCSYMKAGMRESSPGTSMLGPQSLQSGVGRP